MMARELLKIIVLGMALWGLSLGWPEINEGLTPRVTLGLMAGLGAVGVAYLLSQHPHPRPSPVPSQARPLLSPNPRRSG